MKNTISVKGKKLRINGGVPIVFEEEIEEVVDMEDVVIVLTISERGYATVNRVYGVRDGEIVWRVQDMSEYNPAYLQREPDPYVHISVYEEDAGIVVGTTFDGYRFLIDPKDGKILGKDGWTK